MIRIFASSCLALMAAQVIAQNDAGGNDVTDAPRPLLQWLFNDRTEPGPRPPVYPQFATTNTAAFSDGKKPVILVSGTNSTLQFKLNDSITLEAWVRVKEIGNGNLVYILGKGRSKGDTKNQNYSLRLKGDSAETKLSFLFSTAPTAVVPGGWHRWTSDTGFSTGNGWHHVAIAYKFGSSKSLRAYVDGRSVNGKWDMDGATERAPVADNDDLVLGTGNGGGKSNSFIGWMDDIAIWRVALPEEVLKSRYQFAPPAPVVKRENIPPGKVLVQLCEEGLPKQNVWPDEPLAATESYTEQAFGFFAEPQKYVDTGVRGDRANPHLFRAAALIKLPAGKNKLLLRSRGAARLYVDGKPVLANPFPPGDSSGHGLVAEQLNPLNLGAAFRFRPPGNRESWCEVVSTGKEQLFVLETLVGGYMGNSRRRPELGETVLAWSPQNIDRWQLVSPSTRVFAYTDEGWQTYEHERRASLNEIETAARAKLRAGQSIYWDKRRTAAAQWLASTPEISVPVAREVFPVRTPVDHFIAAKITTVTAQMKESGRGSVDYFKQVQPVLEAKCYDCHRGIKAKSGLKLDELTGAIKGGKSGAAAIVPGKPHDSALFKRITTADADEAMPPKGARVTKEEAALIETWIREGAHWPEFRFEQTRFFSLTDDLAFLRRVSLDTVGVPPSLREIEAFLADPSPDKRAAVIDRLLNDPRWADHWTSYWQDVLAENPNILNPTLNNTGPFRWWIYESLLDNKPFDLFVTELIRMKGSERFGGPAGFGVASQNDAPMAAKGTIIAAAFLGVEMKCARCHDAPSHSSMQEELFQLAAMLATKSIDVPITSTVPLDKIHQGGRKPLIQVTLKPGAKIEPKWPFAVFCDEALAAQLAQYPDDSRDRLAAAITAPQNERFAQVIANRVWRRFMGRGLVEPVEDWEKGRPSHPELVRWLGREFVRGGYNVKSLSKLILNSHAYQRATDSALRETNPLFSNPAPRRLGAEQIVDSLFVATGKPFRTEEASLDIDSVRDLGNSISLGQPRRAWMLTSTSNERDRPSLSLPRVQAVADVLTAFGWRGARQDPASRRDESPNTLQPAILGNGVMSTWLTRLSDDHGITHLALREQSIDRFVDAFFLQLLTRRPTLAEKQIFTEHLREGFDTRLVKEVSPGSVAGPRKPVPYVSWSNHLDPEATLVRQQQESDARRGDPPTARLTPAWRTRLENVLWAVLNAPEWVFTP